MPKTGTSGTAGADVAAFYSTWLNYSTLKDFAWADKYNPAAAPNRKVRPSAALLNHAGYCLQGGLHHAQLLLVGSSSFCKPDSGTFTHCGAYHWVQNLSHGHAVCQDLSVCHVCIASRPMLHALFTNYGMYICIGYNFTSSMMFTTHCSCFWSGTEAHGG